MRKPPKQSAKGARVANTRHSALAPDAFPHRFDITRFAEVGRIHRPSGASSRSDYDDRVAVLNELYYDGNMDLLRKFQQGSITMDALMRLKRERRLDTGAGSVELGRPLMEVFDEVLPRLGSKGKTRDGYESLFLRMVRLSIPKLTAESRVRDLGMQKWPEVKKSWAADGVSGTTWNNMIIMLGSFLTEVVGDVKSKDRGRIMSMLVRAPKAPGRVPDATPAQLADVLRRMPRKTGATALSLLVTGLRLDEFMSLDPSADLLPNHQALNIVAASRDSSDDPFTQAAKNAQSMGMRHVADGFWDLVVWAVNNRPAYITLRRHWCQACHEAGLGVVVRTDGKRGASGETEYVGRWPQKFTYEGMTMHDLRHSYSQVVSEAGLPLSQLKSALGHGNESSSERYAAQAKQVAGRKAAQLAGQLLAGTMSVETLWPPEEEPTT